jgi:Tfp pilus assembly protein PilX
MSFLRRLLGRQDGITLIMAIGVLGILTMTGTTLIYYSSTNARTAAYSDDKSGAYDLAEAGVNEMMAVLSRPENNALNKYILGEQANGTVTHTTHTYDEGTVEWWGTLSQSVTGSSTWSLTSIGKMKNPTGASASQVTRTLTAKVPVIPTYTQPLNNPSWNFIYSRATGSTCDMTIQQSVLVNSPLYVAGNLCLQNSAAITAGPLVVLGGLTMTQSANYAGTSTTPLNQLHVKNGCQWKNNVLHNPCQQGAGASGFDNVWATVLDNTPASSPAPGVDWDAWYLNSNPGPYYGCLTTSGTPPTFDNDQGSATTPSATHRNNSVSTVQDLTPSSSYTCKGSGGELSWNASTHVLTANGTIFIDGSAQIQNGAVNTFTGSATIYVSGTLLIKNSKLCQATTGSGSSMTCTTSGWDPAQRMLVFVVNGNGSGGAPQSQVNTGDSVQLISAYAQGALYGTNAVDLDTTSQFDGPLDGSTVKLGQSTSSSFPGLSFVPAGMPGNPDVYAQPQAPQLYAG